MRTALQKTKKLRLGNPEAKSMEKRVRFLVDAKAQAADHEVDNGGGLALFLLHSTAMKENKDQSKQAKDKSVFSGFGDDLAVDYRPHVAKTGIGTRPVESSRMKVADGFVDYAGAHPR